MTSAEHQKTFTTEYVYTGAEGLVSVKDIFGVMVRKWYIAVAICIVSVFASIGAMNLYTPTYESKLIISPKDSQSLSSAPDLGNFSSVYTSLFGGSTKINLLINVIQSERLASLLMKSGDFAQVIFNPQWDAERQTWKQAPGPVPSILGRLRDLGGLDSWYPPDASDMASYLTKNIVIAPDKESGAFIITFAHKDPSFAQRTLRTVYDMAEQILSEEEVNRSNTRLRYFDQLLESSTNLNIRNTVIALADSERRNIAILQSGEHVASNLIQDATLPEKPNSPSLFIFILVGIAIGLVLSLLLALWLHHRATKSRR